MHEGRQLRDAANRRYVHDTDDRLANFEHSCKGRMKCIKHLEDALGSVFTNVDPATKHLAGRVEDDQFDLIAFTSMRDSVGQLTHHGFIAQVVVKTAAG